MAPARADDRTQVLYTPRTAAVHLSELLPTRWCKCCPLASHRESLIPLPCDCPLSVWRWPSFGQGSPPPLFQAKQPQFYPTLLITHGFCDIWGASPLVSCTFLTATCFINGPKPLPTSKAASSSSWLEARPTYIQETMAVKAGGGGKKFSKRELGNDENAGVDKGVSSDVSSSGGTTAGRVG